MYTYIHTSLGAGGEGGGGGMGKNLGRNSHIVF